MPELPVAESISSWSRTATAGVEMEGTEGLGRVRGAEGGLVGTTAGVGMEGTNKVFHKVLKYLILELETVEMPGSCWREMWVCADFWARRTACWVPGRHYWSQVTCHFGLRREVR